MGEKDDLVRRVLQDIVKCFGGLHGDRSPLTLEELQNYEWPIKDIVRKFRTAGMRDGAIRTLEEARKIYEEIPEDVRRTPEEIAAYETTLFTAIANSNEEGLSTCRCALLSPTFGTLLSGQSEGSFFRLGAGFTNPGFHTPLHLIAFS